MNTNSTGDIGSVSESGKVSIEVRVDQFDKALNRAKVAAEKQCETSWDNVKLWLILSFAVVGGTLWIARIFYYDCRIDYADNMHLLYYSLIRLGIISTLIFLISFSFRMLRSYSHIHQRNRFRHNLIVSMSSLVEGAPEYVMKKQTFNQILKEILKGDRTGLLKEEKHDMEFSELLKELKQKIEDVAGKK